MDFGENPVLKADVYVAGVVQGVGFRPFVARMANELKLSGRVWNEGGNVRAELYGPEDAIGALCRRLPSEVPPGSLLRTFEHSTRPLAPGEIPPEGFTIAESGAYASGPIMPSPDLAMCADCLRELFTPDDPRHLNPFISCTHCGPRYSILHSVPYDRPNTSMDRFPMCPLCAQQYRDPADRRFHAQTVCCNDCGPALHYAGRHACADGGEALDAAIHEIRTGGIVAVKGIGGYHLACDPYDQTAVMRLRALKGREYKPFAVMFPDMASLRAHCNPTPEEEALLQSPAAPIVLVAGRHSKEAPSSTASSNARKLAPAVCMGSDDVGAFLPYAPLQHLLLRRLGPLVMTSANPSGLPIIADDAEMVGYFDAHTEITGVLSHDRPIVRWLDDSVAAVSLGGTVMRRRSRGYTPLSIPAPAGYADGPAVLAVGAQEKNAPCLYRRGLFYPAAEVGDLDGVEMEHAFKDSVNDLCELLGGPPDLLASDLHPEYPSTRYAKSAGLPVLEVQHHHAHIVSVMAENGLSGEVIGAALDGTGYGPDGTVWGGEFLVATPGQYRRVGHFRATEMLGGDESVRQGWKSAACFMRAAGYPADDGRAALVYAALDGGVNRIRSSSAGRLFDAVSALLGVCDYSHYDGQCAIELERAATRWAHKCDPNGGVDAPPFGRPLSDILRAVARSVEPLAFDVAKESGEWIVDFTPAIRELLVERGRCDTGELAMRFHLAVAGAITRVVTEIGQSSCIHDVALSGGVFANRIVLSEAHAALSAAGFRVYVNHQVPTGDAGVALGQAYAALTMARMEGR